MARQQVLVVGLGQLGMALARSMSAHGAEVVALDKDPDRVQRVAGEVTEALVLDAMDEDELAQLRPGTRDLCICAIGDESREASIVVTALLRQMGAKRVVARATDVMHERILTLVGAHEVVNPERMMGERLASRLCLRGVLDTLPLGRGLEITELEAPVTMVGRTLEELKLRRRAGLTVLAVRREGAGEDGVVLPEADTRIERGDVVVVVGRPAAARELLGD
ncbi:MAG: TrkA family potassium uptake protein [Alphaproteobacteria bacterium]|nr:TrkA family potassium uptake protein [Alphaproteobacteria bacterium]